MQNIVMYAVADSTLGSVRDYANTRIANAPIFTRGFSVMLKLRLFIENDNSDPYPISAFDGIVSWQCVFDKDYNQATNPILIADNESIIVHSVTETINETEQTFTEFMIPIPDMNTQELVDFIGNNESVSNLNMELVGINGEGNEVFGLQIKGFTVRNRIYYGGYPTDLPVDYLTAEQARALVASGVVIQFSADGTNWHDTQTSSDLYIRVRSASSINSDWSSPIALLRGTQGATPQIDSTTKNWLVDNVDTGVLARGTSTYVYIAFASDNFGSNFSLIPSNNLKYRAEIHPREPIDNVTAEDFTGAEWVKYIGDNGAAIPAGFVEEALTFYLTDGTIKETTFLTKDVQSQSSDSLSNSNGSSSDSSSSSSSGVSE